ncbi:hypothetical protein ILUMI_18672 [Ignelater luminosus]|uniref:Uncharacterized protein n=1 Tax=Ignelater luminosus TaxID=2038154 RepID=A0A8K0CM26_IGNLU|nr:hypothetical protein ILUMI_18672 [Ignelater luminosus]
MLLWNTSLQLLKKHFHFRIWWLFVITIAITGSGILIYNTYVKWVKAPVIVTFATTETPIWKIPFPAVTICPEMKVQKSVFNYSQVFSRIIHQDIITEEESKYFSFFQMVCEDWGIDWEEFVGFNVTEEWINSTALDTYLDALDTMITKDCKWMGKEQDCDNLLTTVYTAEGLCQTFNGLMFDEIYREPEEHLKKKEKQHETKKWSLEDGYPSSSDLDTYPLRTILSGSKAGFQVDLYVTDEQIDYGCGELQGYKVTLHHPGEEPDMDKHFRVPLDEAVFVAVKPRMITTADEIGAYEPEKRQCYLPGEKTLQTFKSYTQQNCMTECLTNYTNKICGCVGFYMAYYGESHFCNLKSKACMENARCKIFSNLNLFLIDTM